MESQKFYNLSRLRKMIGDDNEIRELNELFIKTASATVAEMNTAFDKKNYTKLSELAHKLKSSVRLWDIERVVDDIVNLEEYGKTLRNIEQFPVWLNNVNKVLGQVFAQLEEEL